MDNVSNVATDHAEVVYALPDWREGASLRDRMAWWRTSQMPVPVPLALRRDPDPSIRGGIVQYVVEVWRCHIRSSWYARYQAREVDFAMSKTITSKVAVYVRWKSTVLARAPGG